MTDDGKRTDPHRRPIDAYGRPEAAEAAPAGRRPRRRRRAAAAGIRSTAPDERGGAADRRTRHPGRRAAASEGRVRELPQAGVARAGRGPRSGAGRLLAEFLPVLDNLERALNAAEHHEEGKVLDGVRMTRSMFVDLLRARVSRRWTPWARPSIPTFTRPSRAALRAGRGHGDRGARARLRHGDRVLRPARVVVSAGPGATRRRRHAG